MIAKDWIDYEVIASGNGEKLEKWGNVVLLRPDPQVLWRPQMDLSSYRQLNARYVRESTGGGHWNVLTSMPEEWTIKWKDLRFSIKPMGFKHTGLFPEQAVNWEIMMNLIKQARTAVDGNAPREISVLNLFAYTGGATVACAKAGAKVTHVDAAKGMVDRAKINCNLSGVPTDAVRYIVDDCKKFVEREIKRGKHYDAVIMDPPSYGRGPNGEMWKIEDSIYDLVELTKNVLTDNPLFYLINSYTTGLQPTVMQNILAIVLKDFDGSFDSYEVNLPTREKGISLPCGCSAMFSSNNR